MDWLIIAIIVVLFLVPITGINRRLTLIADELRKLRTDDEQTRHRAF